MISSFTLVIVYLVCTFFIGNVLTKRSQTVHSYFIAKDQLGTGLIMVLVFSELISGSSTVGNASQAYSLGISSVWANVGMCLGGILFSQLLCKFYVVLGKHQNVGTVPDAYGWYFSSRCRSVMTFTVIVVYFILQSLLPKAAAAVLAPMLGVDPTATAWIMCIFFIAIALMGGQKAIANMNVLHTFVMYFGLLIAAVLALFRVGGLSTLTNTLPESFFSFGQPSVSTVVARAAGSMLSLTAAPIIVNDILGAKTYRQAKRGVLFGSLVMIPFAFFPAVLGLCAKVLLPGQSPNNALYAMGAYLGPVWGAVVSMAVLAAILSTAPGNMLVIANSLTWDIYLPYLRKSASQREALIFSRICMIIIGITSCWFGLTNEELMSQLTGALQIKSVAGAVLVIALLWPRVDERAAFWSMLLGGVISVVWFFCGSPFGVEPLWPACAGGLGALVVLTLLSPAPCSASYLKYREVKRLGP